MMRLTPREALHQGMSPEDSWSKWPLMEEEILIVEDEDGYTFNIPYQLVRKKAARALREAGVSYRVVQDIFGNKRVVFRTSKSRGLEVRAWLSILVTNSKYFITEVEEVKRDPPGESYKRESS